MCHISFIPNDEIEFFKTHFPLERIYEFPKEKDDRIGLHGRYEILSWVVELKCVGTSKKTGLSKFKRVTKMSFE